MTAFQWTFVPLLCLAIVYDLARLSTGSGRRRFRLLRIATWIGGALLILYPNSTTAVAKVLGIGQGKDLLLYLFILFSLVAAFGFYTKCQLLERQITALVRADAIRDAKYTNTPPETHDSRQ